MAVNVTGNDSLKFVADIDTDGVLKGAKDIEKAISSTAKTAVETSKKQNAALKDQVKGTTEAVKGIKKQDEATKLHSDSTEDLIKHYKELAKQSREIYEKGPNSKFKELEKEIQSMSNVGKKGFDDLGGAVKKTEKDTGGFMSTIKAGMAGIAAYFTFDAIVGFGKQVLNVTAEFEKLNAVLANTLGSKGMANNAMKMISDFAAKTPFSVAELTDSFVKLANQGFVPTTKELRQLGDLASSTGKGFDQLAEAILDAMSGENERLKEFGIKAQVAGDQVTYTFKGVATTIDNTSDSIKAYLTSLGDVAGVTGSMAVISETLTGKISNLGDTWDQMLVSVGGNTSGVFAGAIDLIAKAISKVTQFNKELNTAAKYSLEGDFLTKVNRAINPFAAKGGTDTELQIAGIENAGDRVREFVTKAIEGATSAKDFSEAILALSKDAREFSLVPGVAQSKGEIKGIKDQYMQGLQTLRDAAMAFINKQETPDLLSPAQKKAAELARKRMEADHERDVKAAEALQQKILDINAEYARKSLTKDDAEVQAVQDKFKRLADEVKKFNEDPKNKIKVNADGLEITREKAITDLKAQQAVEGLKLEIDQKKQLFNQFEEYKFNFGSEKAAQRYSNELGTFKNYIDFLKSLMPADTDLSAKGNAMRDFLAKEIPKAQKDQSDLVFDQTNKNLTRILKATETAKLKELAINKKYDEDLAALRADSTINSDELAQREAKLAEAHQVELTAVKQLAFEESEFYKAAMIDVTNASLRELKQRIRDAKRELANADLSPAERAAIESKLNKAQAGLKGKGVSQDEFGQTIKANSKTAETAKDIAEYAQAAAGSFYEMANALKEIAPGTADTLESLGDIAGVAANAAGAVASFATGDIVGGIKGTISAIAGLFSIGAKSRESERKAAEEMVKFQDDLMKGAVAYNSLMRERARNQKDINELTLKELQLQKQLLAQQTSGAQTDADKLLAKIRQVGQQITGAFTEKYGGFLGIGRKTRTVETTAGLQNVTFEELERLAAQGKLNEATKAWFEELKKVREESDDIKKALEDIEAATSDRLLGGLTADSIADTIIDGFRNGKRAVSDFADSTEDMIRNALLSSLKYSFLEEPLKVLRDQLAADAKTEGLDQNEIAKFSEGVNKVIADSLKIGEQISKATGINLSNPGATGASGNTLSGAIKGMTETQADLLAGQFGGLRLTALNQLQVATQSLDIQRQIEVNTRITSTVINSVDRSLKSIDAAVSKSAGVAGANGRVVV